MHFQRICSAIRDFPPDVNFDVSQSELHFADGSGLSQDLGASKLVQSTSSQSSQGLPDNHSSVVEAQNVTPGTSVNESGPFKRLRRKRGRKATETPSP